MDRERYEQYRREQEKRQIIEEDGLYFKEPKNRKQKTKQKVLLIFSLLIFVGATVATTLVVINYFHARKVLSVNVDTDGDGWPDLNVDINGNGKCDVNCDTNGDNKPDINIGYQKTLISFFNIDTNGDGKPDKNLINQDTNNDGKCDVNCDINNDGYPEMNLDFNGTGVARINLDTNGNGKCDLNCDVLGLRSAQVNIDTDNDGKADINIDINGDGKPEVNVTYGNDYENAIFGLDTDGDGKPDDNLVNQMSNGKCEINCVLDKGYFPVLNVDIDGDGKTDLNIDTNNDNLAELNVDINGNGKCDLNCDTDGDGKADINVSLEKNTYLNLDYDRDGKADINLDTNGDGKPDKNLMNQEENGKCVLNCDLDGNGIPNLNIDIDGDGKPDINIDLNGDGKADANLDTDDDRIPDRDLIDTKIDIVRDALISAKGLSYSLDYLDKYPSFSEMVPGWKGTKSFKVTNNSSDTIMYDIEWDDLVNTFTYENRPFYSVVKDGNTLVAIQNGRFSYSANNGEKFVSSISINPGETHNYVINYEFNKNNTDQSVDNGKIIFGRLKIVTK